MPCPSSATGAELSGGRPSCRPNTSASHAKIVSCTARFAPAHGGYLTKDAGAEDIAQAVAAVASGQMVLDTAAQARVVANLERRSPAGAATAAVSGVLPDELTPREAEILGLVADGLSNAEIATRLVVGEATVKTHITLIFAKTARDRAQAVTYAYRAGLAAP